MKHKGTIFILLIILFHMPLFGANKNLYFHISKNTSNSSLENINTREIDKALRVITDDQNNWYILGYSYGNFDQLQNQGFSDIFIIKMNHQQKKLYTLLIGTRNSDIPVDFIVDHDQNIYIVGESREIISTNPDLKRQSFLLKIDSKGQLAETVNFKEEMVFNPHLMDVDKNNNLYLSCVKILERESYKRKPENYVQKYNSFLNLLWEKQITLIDENTSASLILFDDALYLSGLIKIGSTDASMWSRGGLIANNFVCKLNNYNGSVEWSKQIQTKSYFNRLVIQNNNLELIIKACTESVNEIYGINYLFQIYNTTYSENSSYTKKNHEVWSIDKKGNLKRTQKQLFNDLPYFTEFDVHNDNYYSLTNFENKIALHSFSGSKEVETINIATTVNPSSEANDLSIQNDYYMIIGTANESKDDIKYNNTNSLFCGSSDMVINMGKTSDLNQNIVENKDNKKNKSKNAQEQFEDYNGYIQFKNPMDNIRITTEGDYYIRQSSNVLTLLDFDFNIQWQQEIENIKFLTKDNINNGLYILSQPNQRILDLNIYGYGGLITKFNKDYNLEWQQEFGIGNLDIRKKNLPIYGAALSETGIYSVFTNIDSSRNYKIWQFKENKVINTIDVPKEIVNPSSLLQFLILDDNLFLFIFKKKIIIMDSSGNIKKEKTEFTTAKKYYDISKILLDKNKNIYCLISNTNDFSYQPPIYQLEKFSSDFIPLWQKPIYIIQNSVNFDIDNENNIIFISQYQEDTYSDLIRENYHSISKVNADGRASWTRGLIFGKDFSMDMNNNIYLSDSKNLISYTKEGQIIMGAEKKTQPPSSPNIVIKNLTSSSTLTEPNDINAYHGAKVFDNDPKTMWIENAKDFGQDEWLEIELEEPVTIDTIIFQPGCFWDTYWKQNYRIKTLQLWLDDKSITINFKDIMQDQGCSLSEALTFSKMKIIIIDVYPSTKWKDTALSGIKFLMNKKELQVDLNNYAEYIKKEN